MSERWGRSSQAGTGYAKRAMRHLMVFTLMEVRINLLGVPARKSAQKLNQVVAWSILQNRCANISTLTSIQPNHRLPEVLIYRLPHKNLRRNVLISACE